MTEPKKRRPVQNYFRMGLRNGDRLIFMCAPELDIFVFNERRLSYGGADYSMTALRNMFYSASKSTNHSSKITICREDFKEEDRDFNTLYRKTHHAN